MVTSLHYQLHKPDPLRVLLLSMVCSSQSLPLPGRKKVGKECEARSCSKEPLKIRRPERTDSVTDPSAVNKQPPPPGVKHNYNIHFSNSVTEMDCEGKDGHDEASNPT